MPTHTFKISVDAAGTPQEIVRWYKVQHKQTAHFFDLQNVTIRHLHDIFYEVSYEFTGDFDNVIPDMLADPDDDVNCPLHGKPVIGHVV